MKTVHLREEDFSTICEALSDAAYAMKFSVTFLSARFGPESDQVKAEEARFARLVAAQQAFSEDLSAWRRPKHQRLD